MIAAAAILSPKDALLRAIEAYGSQAATARRRRVSQPTVWGWVHRIGQLPAEHVLGVEADTGVSKHDLRPDLYPRDASVPAGGATAGAGGSAATSFRADPVPDSLSGLSA